MKPKTTNADNRIVSGTMVEYKGETYMVAEVLPREEIAIMQGGQSYKIVKISSVKAI